MPGTLSQRLNLRYSPKMVIRRGYCGELRVTE
jgi:hypothetical protein